MGRTVNIYERFSDRKVTENVKRVSAIVPNYNYARFLKERIDSIVNQTYPVAELIVLDDCSTDNSREVIEEILKGITDIDVKFIPNEVNSGSVFSQWQKGIRACTGEYFWICEADDSAEPDFLETCMSGFAENENVVLAYTDSARIDDDNNVIRENCQDLYNMFGTDHWDHSFVTKGSEEVKNYLSVLNTILNVSGVVWKKSDDIVDIMEDAKKYHVAGDWYIYTKVLEKGDLAFSSRSLNYYRKHTGSVTSSVKADVEYGEICEIEEMVAEKYHAGMDIYRWQRLRRSYMDHAVSKEAHKKRIAWIIPHPGKGSGGHRTIIQNVNALIRHGYECDIFVEDDGVSNAEMVLQKIEEYYEPCAAKVYVGFAHQEDYDLLFVTGWQTIDFGRMQQCQRHGYFIQDFEPWFFPMGNEYLIIEDSYRLGYSPVTIGKWLSYKMQNEFGCHAQYFDFCADLNVYHPLENVEKEKAVCYVWQPEKPRRGSEVAFRALTILKKMRPDIKVYLYGSAVEAEVPFEAEKLGIIPVDQCNELYNRCMVGLCMSASNPSRIPFEMMAAGLPVVELYRENNLYDLPEEGVSLAQSSPADIAADIIRLVDDEEERQKMSSFGVQYMQDYPLEKGFEQFTAAVDLILADKTEEAAPVKKMYEKPAYTADEAFRKEAEEILLAKMKEKQPVQQPENAPESMTRILKRKARSLKRRVDLWRARH